LLALMHFVTFDASGCLATGGEGTALGVIAAFRFECCATVQQERCWSPAELAQLLSAPIASQATETLQTK
jgi:hypothetical protein